MSSAQLEWYPEIPTDAAAAELLADADRRLSALTRSVVLGTPCGEHADAVVAGV